MKLYLEKTKQNPDQTKTPHPQTKKPPPKQSQTELALTQHQVVNVNILNGMSQIKIKVWQYCSKTFGHKI